MEKLLLSVHELDNVPGTLQHREWRALLHGTTVVKPLVYPR